MRYVTTSSSLDRGQRSVLKTTMAQAPVEPHPSPSAGPVVKEYTPEASTGKDINVGKPAEQLDLEPSAETSTAEDESTYTTGAKFYLIALSIGLVLIVAGMDASSTFNNDYGRCSSTTLIVR